MIGPGIRSIAVNAAYLSSARVVTSTARAFYAVVLAKWLGPELYGLVNYGLSWYLLFLPISVLGLDAILIREIGRDRARAERLSGLTLALRTTSSFVIATISFSLALLIETDPVSRQLLCVFSVALFGRGLSVWANAIFRAHEASGFVLGQEIFFRLLEVIVGFVLLLLGFGVIEIAIVHATCWLLQGMSGLVLIRRYLLNVRMLWERTEILMLVKSGILFVASSFLLSWLLQGPVLMYRYVHGVDAGLGGLALALQALFIIGSIVSEAGSAALPVLARSVDRGDGKGDKYVALVLRGGVLVSGIMVIAAIGVAPQVVQSLFGESYPFTAFLLPWTLALVAPFFWVHALSSMIVAHGQYKKIVLNNGLGALAFTAAFPLFVSAFDRTGVVYALAVGLLVTALGRIVILSKYHSLPFFEIILRSGVAAGGGVLVTIVALQVNQWAALALGCLALIAISFFVGVLSLAEIRMAVGLLRRRS